MAHLYDDLTFLVEERRRELLAEAAGARRAAAVRPHARPDVAPRRLRAGAAALLYGLAVRLDRRYALTAH